MAALNPNNCSGNETLRKKLQYAQYMEREIVDKKIANDNVAEHLQNNFIHSEIAITSMGCDAQKYIPYYLEARKAYDNSNHRVNNFYASSWNHCTQVIRTDALKNNDKHNTSVLPKYIAQYRAINEEDQYVQNREKERTNKLALEKYTTLKERAEYALKIEDTIDENKISDVTQKRKPYSQADAHEIEQIVKTETTNIFPADFDKSQQNSIIKYYASIRQQLTDKELRKAHFTHSLENYTALIEKPSK